MELRNWRFRMPIDDKLVWSANPGCFERHLQRRVGNPLFPASSRYVTQVEIDGARARDSREAEIVRNEFVGLCRRIAQMKVLPFQEAHEVERATDQLLTRA